MKNSDGLRSTSPMQWADAVKVVSRGTPRSRTSVNWGIHKSVSAVEEDGESWGRFPAVKHAHLLGLIGRSNFSAQAQPEESGGRRRLDWDRGYTIFTLSVASNNAGLGWASSAES